MPVRAYTTTESLLHLGKEDRAAQTSSPMIMTMTGRWRGALDRLQKAGIDVEDIPGMEWHGNIGGGCKPATATSEKYGHEPATATSEKHGHEPAWLTSTPSCSLGFLHPPLVTFC